MFSKEEIALAKPCYEAIKKISKGKWEWEPEVWDAILIEKKDEAPYVWRVLPETIADSGYYGPYINEGKIDGIDIEDEKITPLLHWERIEEMLEGMGYYLYFCNKRQPKDNVYAEIRQGNMFNKMIVIGQGKSRQEAVQMAVIELGKEK